MNIHLITGGSGDREFNTGCSIFFDSKKGDLIIVGGPNSAAIHRIETVSKSLFSEIWGSSASPDSVEIQFKATDKKGDKSKLALNINSLVKFLGISKKEVKKASKTPGQIEAMMISKMKTLTKDKVDQILSFGKEAGLTKEEAWTIQNWITKNITNLTSIDIPLVLRFPKEETGLPRTIEICKSQGKIHVMVLCKTKQRIPSLGKGTSKTAKLAIDWLTGERFANLVIFDPKQRKWLEKQELALMEKLDGKPGIAKPYFGIHTYDALQKDGHGSSSVVEKLSFFMPLYLGNMRDLILKGNLIPKTSQETDEMEKKQSISDFLSEVESKIEASTTSIIEIGTPLTQKKLTEKDKMQLFSDVIDGLCSMQDLGIEHRDIKEANIYIEHVAGQYRAKIGDFGTSRDMQTDKLKLTKTDELNQGSMAYFSPEKKYLAILQKQMRMEGSKSEHQIKEFQSMIEAQTKTADVWATGLTLLALLTDSEDPNSEMSPIVAKIADEVNETFKGIGKIAPKEIEEVYAILQVKIDEIIEEEGKKNDIPPKALTIIKLLLKANPKERISSEKARELLKT